MTSYSVDAYDLNLRLSDTPVGYTPPVGPSVWFTISYSALDIGSSAGCSNLGPQWNCNWVAYILDDPNNQATTSFGPGGGLLAYSGYAGTGAVAGSFPMQRESHRILVRTSGSSYEQDGPDGSRQIYGLSDGGSPQRVFLTSVIDPQGNQVTYNYDSHFRLTSVTDAIGQVSTLTYVSDDPANGGFYHIAKVTDPFGRYATFSYNSAGQLQSTTDIIGITSSYAYSGTFVSSLTTPYGTTKFTSGTAGNEPTLQITDPLGGTEFYEMSNANLPVSTGAPTPANMAVDTTNQQYQNTFYWSKQAFLSGTTPQNARIYHWLLLPNGALSDALESQQPQLESRIYCNYAGQQSPIYTGSINLPTAVGRVDSGSTQLYQYAYNAQGNQTMAIDPLGRTTTYQYAANGIDRLAVYQRNPAGVSMDISGSAADLIASYTYNNQHRPLTRTDASMQTTSYTYNSAGQVLTVTDPKNETTTYAYDSNGYLQSITGAIPGAVTSYSYDSYGRIQTVTDSEGYTVTTAYDAADRPVQRTYPDGTSEVTTYKWLDMASRQDRLGRTSYFFYDADRHLVIKQDPLLRATQYKYCICGALDGITDANGNQTSFMRDVESRIIDKVYNDGSTTAYTYENSTSRLKSVTDAMGQSTNYSYNVDNTLAGVSYTNAQVATPSVSYTYDSVYNRIAGMVDVTGSTMWFYNPVTSGTALGQNKVASITGRLANSTIGYSYDQLGRVVNRSINGAANTETTAFDALGRATGVANPLATGTAGFQYGYLGETRLVSGVNYPDGQQVNYSYYGTNGDERLQQIQNIDPSSNVISQFNYGYDAAGEITSWQQANSAFSGTNGYGVNYDAASQLSGATLTNGSAATNYNYAYDLTGNRTQEQIGGATTSSTYNGLNQLIGVVAASGSGSPLNYDLDGNLLFDGTNNYQWDAANRLVKIWYGAAGSSPSTAFTCNGLSQRVGIVEKDGSGNVTSTKNFVWYPGSAQPSEERDASNNVTKRFYSQGEQIGGASYFYTRDHLGSVREMTDSSGTIHARYNYDLWGRLTKVSGDMDSAFAYAGYYNHLPSGLYLTLYRAYSPNFGRWISRDPIADPAFGVVPTAIGYTNAILRGQPGEMIVGPNLYGYVHEDPINRTDPWGLWSPYGSGNDGPVLSGGNGTLGSCHKPDPCDGPPGGIAAPQDGICSFPGGQYVGARLTKCCAAHDQCYTNNGCNAYSWIPGCGSNACHSCNCTVVKCFLGF